jgi:hypothetical protein
VYVWIAVFVLPVNSAINPFLYTFSNLQICQTLSSTSRDVGHYLAHGMSNVLHLKGEQHNETN